MRLHQTTMRLSQKSAEHLFRQAMCTRVSKAVFLNHPRMRTQIETFGRASMIDQETFVFPIGARVRFNKLGAARSPKMSSRVGTVVKAAGSNGVRVFFDGTKTINTIHRSYLELVIEQDIPNEAAPAPMVTSR